MFFLCVHKKDNIVDVFLRYILLLYIFIQLYLYLFVNIDDYLSMFAIKIVENKVNLSVMFIAITILNRLVFTVPDLIVLK